jgi:hypothetical protein
MTAPIILALGTLILLLVRRSMSLSRDADQPVGCATNREHQAT